MYLFGKRADTLKEEDILRLVSNKIPENKSLDYKRDLKLSQDKDRKEFLFDVTSMANTDGGCLVYGIEEAKDEKGQNTGIPEMIVGFGIDNFDKLAQAIEDNIKGNTEPRITNIALNPITVKNKNVLVVGISKSLGLPVMVTFNETNKFYRRRNSGKYCVDVYELNQMFMQNLVLKESA
ncbi:MAG TPA: ATP-binding protein [Puia sp.]|jgi:predicted HTH transcriptional regulator|nr:ATP-binding protein [Puia sp.]